VRAATPTVEQLEQLLRRVAARVRALVAGAGPEPDLPEVQVPLLRVYGADPTEPAESSPPKLVASYDGFNLHAATSFEGHERMAIERWCRYALRGPLAASRLSLGPRDTVVYELAKPKADGTTQLVFPVESFLRRLCAVLPLPRHHTIVYHGVFASAHRWRPEVVESAPRPSQMCPRRRWLPWADLLKRVFSWTVLACACGATRRVLAVIPAGPIAEKILTHLGLPTEAPALGRARPGAQRELWDTGPPVDLGQAQAPSEDLMDQRLAECEFPE
jgi:Putative transposase